MKKVILVAFVFLTACTNEKEASRVLKMNGYSNITYTGYQWFSCSKGDFYNTGFVATNPTGLEVSGTVCSGLLFKSSTIRF